MKSSRDGPARQLADECFLGRQPILDRRQQIVAYELLFRNKASGAALIDNHAEATSTVLLRVLSDLGLDAALEDKRAFVNFDTVMLHSGSVELLDPERFVIEIIEHVEPGPGVLARCRALKSAGFTLALDDYTRHEDRFREILEFVDIVKVDLLPLGDAEVAALVAQLRPFDVTLLAEKIDSRARLEACRDLGFELFQGFYFARPTIVTGRKLDHSELALIRLLGLVLREASGVEVEAEIKREPALAVGLLRLANSPGIGLARPVASLREALYAVGLKPLQRWLQLLIFANSGADTGAAARLQWAAARARFLELLAEKCGGDARLPERAFLTGILSFLPAVLGLSLEDVLRLVPVAEDVARALRDEAGPLGELLGFVSALDGNPDEASGWARVPAGLGATQVNQLHAQALEWATEAGRALHR